MKILSFTHPHVVLNMYDVEQQQNVMLNNELAALFHIMKVKCIWAVEIKNK